MSTRSNSNYARACLVAMGIAVVAAACSSSQPQGAQSGNDGGASIQDAAADHTIPTTGDDDTSNEAGALGDDGGEAVCAEAGVCAADGCRQGMTLCDGTCGALVDAPNGTSCGANGTCESGICVACELGAACSPAAKPCDNGTLSCSTSGSTCVDQGTTAPAGTSCGTASAKTFCDPSGDCTCKAGVACTLTTNACHIGLTSCSLPGSLGVAKCIDSGSSLLNGASCGVAGSACNFGVCEPFTCTLTTADGGVPSCVPPTNPCDRGTVASCPNGEFGAPMCTDTGSPSDAGIACDDGGACNGDGGCSL
jgi:hypothetical protein